MEKFRNKFRIPSIRMRNWNYAGQATYFLTICTHKRIFYFGKISKGINHLSVLGNIVDFAWQAGFYDRIIWEDSDFITYWDYIKDNPKKWEDDEFH